MVGTGYTKYGQHHGTSHDNNAALQQGRNTTRLSGEDLQKVREEISSFNYILGMTEKTTGMEVILADLLRQSSSNEGGRQEALFTPHIDNDSDRPKSVLTAICLLSNTKTSMRVCGKQEFFYQNMRHTAIFPSDIFHETVFAEASTMKLAMFLRLPEKDKSLKTLSRTTRAQYKAVEQPSPSLSWKLDKKPSPRAHKMENTQNSQKKAMIVTLVNYL